MQCRSAEGNIYQSTLTKAHFTHFPNFLSSFYFFFFICLLQNICRFKNEKKNPKSKVLVLFYSGAWAAHWKLTKGIGSIHQKEVTPDISHYTNLHRVFCITNGCTVAFAVLFEYQWAAWSTLLSKGARSSFGYKSITINEAVETVALKASNSFWTLPPCPWRGKGEGKPCTGTLVATGILFCWLAGDVAASPLHYEWTKTAGAHPK